MSKEISIKELLKGVEVEWKSLKEVAIIGTGSHDTKDAVDNGAYIFYARGRKPLKLNTYDFDETAIITAGDGVGVGKVFHWAEGKYALHQRAYRIVPSAEVNSRYVYYYVIDNFYEYVVKTSVQSSVSSLRKPMFLKFPIPIPPLPIQNKIVQILDNFTELTADLTAELTAELTARRKQYSYYLDKLYTFEDGEVEFKALGEIGEVKRGVAFTKKQAVFGKYPVVANAAEPISFHNAFNRNGEFIVIARSGANAGLISYWNEELFLTDAFSIHSSHSVLNTKFAYYFLKKNQIKIHLMKRGVGVPHVRASDFEVYKIPVPSLEEQQRIVDILDKFDTLTNSISEGLPKEIKLREQQYEYYRELLLSFPKDEKVD